MYKSKKQTIKMPGWLAACMLAVVTALSLVSCVGRSEPSRSPRSNDLNCARRSCQTRESVQAEPDKRLLYVNGTAEISTIPADASRIRVVGATGNFFPTLSHLVSLSEVMLEECELRPFVRGDPASLPSVHSLSIINCRAADDASVAYLLGMLPTLKVLSIQGAADIQCSFLRDWNGFESLESLDLLNCHGITLSGLAALEHFPKLRILKLPACSFAVTSSGSSVELPVSVKELNLSENRISEEGFLAILSGAPHVINLSMAFSDSWDQRVTRTVGNMETLQVLNISYCQTIKDIDVALLARGKCAQITTLLLDGCPGLSAATSESLLAFEKLVTMSLAQNEWLTDADMIRLIRKHEFAYLYLMDTRITDTVVNALKSERGLRLLDVSGCPLVSFGAVDSLRQALPTCTVVYKE